MTTLKPTQHEGDLETQGERVEKWYKLLDRWATKSREDNNEIENDTGYSESVVISNTCMVDEPNTITLDEPKELPSSDTERLVK